MRPKPRQIASKTLLADLAQTLIPEPQLPPANLSRHLGYRDALAMLCVLIRKRGVQGAVRQTAEHLLTLEPENPHAQWVLDELHPFRKKPCRTLIVLPESQRKAA